MKTNLIRFCLVAILAAPMAARGATIDVFFAPADSTVEVGQTFNVALRANIGPGILGWGLDLTYDTTVLNLLASSVGPLWSPAIAMDGDGLVGVAFPSAISGNDLLLASLTFEALMVGNSSLAASYTPGDFTEGFALPSPPGAFVGDVAFTGGSVLVNAASGREPVPEPGTMILLGSGLAALAGAVRRVNRKA